MDAEELAVQWLEWHRDTAENAVNTYSKYAGVMMRWFDWCRIKHIDAISPSLSDMEAFVTRARPALQGRKGTPATQNFDAKVLRGFYGWAALRDHLPKNLAVDLRGPREKVRNPRPIEDVDWAVMWGYDLPDRLRCLLGFGYFTGLRISELQSLTVKQVQPHRLVNVRRKGGHEHTVPWHDMARIVRKHNATLLPDLLTFTGAVGRVRKHFQTVVSPYRDQAALRTRFTLLCEQLNLPHYTPHQLRHSCATNLVNAGLPLHKVQALMNHASIDTTLGYVRANPNDLRAYLDD